MSLGSLLDEIDLSNQEETVNAIQTALRIAVSIAIAGKQEEGFHAYAINAIEKTLESWVEREESMQKYDSITLASTSKRLELKAQIKDIAADAALLSEPPSPTFH